MIEFISEEQCCLCKACKNVCPVGAISFSCEINSFFYPKVDSKKCINCDKCEKVCPALNKVTKHNSLNLAYASFSKDIANRENSSSGGIFFECAKEFINEGGSVCGAVWDESFRVKHIISNDISTITKMRGSKYVQSDMGTTYQMINKMLVDGHKVLFSGCPCQVNALHSYLKKDYSNLFSVDFVCHGIPSARAFQEYKEVLEKKYGSKIKNVSFRDKSYGWHSGSVKIEFENGKVYQNPITVDPYMRAFLSGTMMKESCYLCKYKLGRSYSDITLADFWGAEVLFPELDDNKGLSAVVVNTEKGLNFISNLDINLYETDIQNVINYNKNLVHPTTRSNIRKIFLEECTQYGYGETIIRTFGETFYETMARKFRYNIRCFYYHLRGRGKPLY